MTIPATPSTVTPAAISPSTAAPSTTAPTAGAHPAASGESQPVNPGGELGKNDFLKLMVAQLQAQNPLEPSNGTEYISELAQFSQLEQTTNIAQTSAQSASSQLLAQALGLIGHTVSYTDHTTGATVEGSVQSVEITSSGASLTIGSTAGIEPGEVTEVS